MSWKKKTRCFEHDAVGHLTQLPRLIGESTHFLVRMNGADVSDDDLRRAQAA